MVLAIFEISRYMYASKHFMFAKLSVFFLRKGSEMWEGDRISKIPSTVLETRYWWTKIVSSLDAFQLNVSTSIPEANSREGKKNIDLEIETDCAWRCSSDKPYTKNLPIVEHKSSNWCYISLKMLSAPQLVDFSWKVYFSNIFTHNEFTTDFQ